MNAVNKKNITVPASKNIIGLVKIRLFVFLVGSSYAATKRQNICNSFNKLIMAQHKDRKSEAQKRFEQADNAGRFAGNDADAKAAWSQSMENIRQDRGINPRHKNNGNENTDAGAHRDPAQSHDYKGEAQNVNDDTGRPLNENETSHARNKANEGIKQGRGGGSRGRSEKIY